MKNEHSTDTTPNLRHKILCVNWATASALGYAVPFQLLSSSLFYCTAILAYRARWPAR